MKVLLDTNILGRLAEPGHPMHKEALEAVKRLSAHGNTLCIVPQNIYEFWVVSTRPTDQNGVGKTALQASEELTSLKGLFVLLDETEATFPAWESLIARYAVVGKNAHDAHLVATMLVHGVAKLLTFNEKDFHRYLEITILTPRAVCGFSAPQMQNDA